MTLANGSLSDKGYELGQYITSHQDQLAGAAQNPLLWSALVGGVLTTGAATVGTAKAVGPAKTFIHRGLFHNPGELLVGYRQGKFLTRHPVYHRLLDRMMHLQVIAPTGQAKTTLLVSFSWQDLLSGVTVFSLETAGDLSFELMARARVLNRPIHYFNPADKQAMKWNPLSGDPEIAAERAVTTFRSAVSSGNEDFFKNFNSMVLRHSIMALSAYEHNKGREPNMRKLTSFLVDEGYRGKVLGLGSGKKAGKNGGSKDAQTEAAVNSGGPKDNKQGSKGKSKGGDDRRAQVVNIPGLHPDTKAWFEKQFLSAYTQRQRVEFTSGLQSSLEILLGRTMVKDALSPEEGEPQLKIDEALDSGGLVLPCIPQGIVGDTSTRVLSTWMLLDFQQAVRARGEGGYPVMAYLDEAHNMLGHDSSEAAQSFSTFVTQARHHNVGLTLAYQSFALLPWELRATLGSNARSKLISGGGDPFDAEQTQALMGYEEAEVTDRRRNYRGLLSGPGSYSVGTREQEKARYSLDDIRRLPRGSWLFSQVRNGQLQEPQIVTARIAPRPRQSRYGEADVEQLIASEKVEAS